MKNIFNTAIISLLPFVLAAQINNGFYLRMGLSMPLGSYATDQHVHYTGNNENYIWFPKAKLGYQFELGCHIYTGKAFNLGRLRMGIDATFFNYSLQPHKRYGRYIDDQHFYEDDVVLVGSEFYLTFRQKYGPILSYSLEKDIFFDFGYRMVPSVAFAAGSDFLNIWGRRINQEILINFRWKLMMVSFQFDIGKINFNDFEDDGFLVSNSTFNLLLGVKF
jgi:hypothetical protein